MTGKKENILIRFFKGYMQAWLNHRWVRWIHYCFFLQLVIGLWIIKPDLSKSVEEPHFVKSVFGLTIPFGGYNPVTVYVTWLIMAIMIGFAWFVTRDLKMKPTRLQMISEKIVGALTMLCEDTLGERGPSFVPLVGTVFLLVWLSNMIGLIPLPHLEEPTANMNMTLALGTISFLISHAMAIIVRGFRNWAKSYCFGVPIYIGFPSVLLGIALFGIHRFTAGPREFYIAAAVICFILGFLLSLFVRTPVKFYIPNPLDIIGEFGKLISHSMRLFGNIFGGLVIIIVISKLFHYIMVPTLLSGFFGIFVGTVQAFVFSMLVLVYTAVLVSEEE